MCVTLQGRVLTPFFLGPPKKGADDEKERSAAGFGGNSAAPRKRGDEGCGDGLDEMAGFSARVIEHSTALIWVR